MATYNTVIKKRNATNNGWDSVLPITTTENVLVNAEGDTLATHFADNVPHRFTDTSTGKTYRWGMKAVNGVAVLVYEEVV